MGIRMPHVSRHVPPKRLPQNHRIRGVRARMHCWYRSDQRCRSVKDCTIAGRCLEMWNPATSLAIRRGAGGALWVWADQ